MPRNAVAVLQVLLVPLCFTFHALSIELGPLSLTLHPNKNYRPNPVAALQRARYKYGGGNSVRSTTTTATEQGQVVSVSSGGSTAAVALKTILYDVEYYATVQVGTPGQSLRLNFDTGSADLWFVSSMCTSCGKQQKKFNHRKSSTFKDEGTPWSITYGDGSKSGGVVGYDTVRLGNLKVVHQAIQLAKQESESLRDEEIEGVLGLGFPKLATVKSQKTLLQNLDNQRLLRKPMFGVYLRRYKLGGGGEFIFGGYNPDRFEGKLTDVPVDTSRGYWSVNAEQISAGAVPAAENIEAILDTGTSLIVFPKDVAQKVARLYNATDNGDGSFNIPCSKSSVKPMNFQLGGVQFHIPPESLIYYNDGFACTAGFGYADLSFVVLGDMFIKHNYVVFDYATPQVRIAPVKD